MTETAVLRRHIGAQRREFADLLDSLPGASWEAPSLCAGWRVRDVVAHMTIGFRYSLPRFVLEMLKARGNFNRMADQTARRDGSAFTPAELAGLLHANADHPWKPPGSGYEAPLGHDIIHGLDITVALGLEYLVPPQRLAIVLADTTPNSSSVKFFGADLSGVRLAATDLDFTFGTGATVEGLAQDLLLVICGRKLPAGRLRGESADRFTATS
ncbi:maleylpyruvate isomerase family mycothiol-dependent enzyme [Hoyosella altamirensis]|uniref:Uncharacterized protein (TIGR03083 family) n=1 Tax=Hoyosella altamirensis TaxID=616997 RepID=A0A839RL45_9ACTN|nr:maleylpyruvate isomerase family mycothiol-dependent enzyme [Hoyosella altamirensis]MBB3036783.1 uncharacterized protein (TIGR03083 family) [Hoyosella altamirensis]